MPVRILLSFIQQEAETILERTLGLSIDAVAGIAIFQVCWACLYWLLEQEIESARTWTSPHVSI